MMNMDFNHLTMKLCLWFCVFRLVSAVPVTDAWLNSCNESSAVSSEFSLWDHLPKEWCEICAIDYDVDTDVNATVSCHVTPRDQVQWRLVDLRTALKAAVVDSMNLELAVDLHCDPGTNISLPFPMRAPGLVKLKVSNCRLLDKYADCKQSLTTTQPQQDWMRVMIIDSCTWINDPEDLDFVSENLKNLTEDLECGQDGTIVTYVYRNNSEEVLFEDLLLDTIWETLHAKDFNHSLGGGAENVHSDADSFGDQSFGAGSRSDDGAWDANPEDAGRSSGKGQEGQLSEAGVSEEYLQGQIQLSDMDFRCRFANLETLDESFNLLTSNTHFQLLAQNSRYPKLTLLNYTSTGLTHIPVELLESRRAFPRSKLGIIDLSHNWIQDVGPILAYPSGGISTTLILQFNNITQMSFSMFKEWASVPDFFVDMRNNPITCDCSLRDLIGHLQNDSQWKHPAMAYYKGQLSVMSCATPPELYGKVIGSLGIEDLPCSEVVADIRPGLVGLLSVTSLLVVLTILMVRYRREVRILMYTRVHFLIPCRCLQSRSWRSPHAQNAPGQEEKLFDAFVAYAHQDSHWVLGSLMPHLEDPTSSSASSPGVFWRCPPSKLCLHQRDFVVGKPIIDNIVDSIAASRHTIVVVSRSFVRSGWAMEELYQAYQQSLVERRRHLVLVMLEDVPMSEMAPVLRRCCQTFTYLRVSDTLFWDRLLYSIHANDKCNNTMTTKPASPSTTTDTECDTSSKKNDNKWKTNAQPEEGTNTTRHTFHQNNDSKGNNNRCKNGGNKGDDFFQHGGTNGNNHFENSEKKKGDDSFQNGVKIGQDCVFEEDGEIQESCLGEDLKRAVFSQEMRSISMESARTSSTSDSNASVPLTPSQLAWERPLIFEDV